MAWRRDVDLFRQGANLDSAIIAQKLIFRERSGVNADADAVRQGMVSMIRELRFLSTFLAYSHLWSDPSSHNLDSQIIKVAEEFAKELNNGFVHNYRFCYFIDYSWGFNLRKSTWWRRTRLRFPCCASKPSEFLHVFACLNEKIDSLKLEIRKAYDPLPRSSFDLHPAPVSTKSYFKWDQFCKVVETNLHFLSVKSDLGGPIRKRMKDLMENICYVKPFLKKNYFYDWYREKDDMVARFREVIIGAAHMCCLCWYGKVDQNLEKDVSTSLSNLHQKIDIASPEFLRMFLATLEAGSPIRDRLAYIFVHYMLPLSPLEVHYYLKLMLESMVTCAIELQNMCIMEDALWFPVDIKDVFMEARYLRNKDYRTYKTDLVLLFARIWFFKAKILVKNGSNFLRFSMQRLIKRIHYGSRFLTTYFTATAVETDCQIFKLIEGVPRQVESLYPSLNGEDLVRNKVRDVLYKFLVQIMLFKAKELSNELLNNDASLMLPLKHQIGTLHEGLILVIGIINQPKDAEDEKHILAQCQTVANGVTSLCNSFRANEVTEEAVKGMESWLQIHLQIPRLNFSKAPGLWFIEFLLQNLRELISRKPCSVSYSTHQIEAMHLDLEFLMSMFQDVIEGGIQNQECKDLHTRFVNVAYEIEYVIDSMVVGNDAVWQNLLWLYHLSEEVRQIKLQVTDIFKNNTCDVGVHNVPQRLMRSVSKVSTPSTEEVMVGLNDQKEVVIDRLTRGTLQRDIVSIVGMPGIGKTTLANNVFCCPSVTHHFHIRAWCCVSQIYRKRDLLLDILSHIIRLTDNILAMSDDDLDLVLYKHLKKRRYLIIMDDMWSTEAWDDLQSSFPDDSNGSRILMTSRLHDVVSKISDPHPLRLLSEDESWELLKIKLFREEGCPEDLLEVGQQIAKNCSGLPLAIGAVVGLLDRTNKNRDWWKEIAESVSSRIVNDPQTRCMDILELSYKHLPDYLKACFLYFGAFPEDKDIPVQRLLWFWIAEGFVHKLESKSLEDHAEDNLMDLVGRSLVMVAKRRSNGKVKACRIHDMVRDLCLLKAKDENFLQPISSNDEPYPSFHSLDYGIHYELFNPSNSITYKEHRLCFCVNREHFVASWPSGPCVRSLLFFATTDMYPRCPYDVSFISNNFKLLRVLDLESINMGNSLTKGIKHLVHLRFLAVCGDMDFIPSWLSNLQNLETLIVKGLKSKVVLPDTLWCMTKLRHLHVNNHAIFTFLNDENGSCTKLENLVTLSLPSFSHGEDTNNTITRFPNLRKLRCIFLESRDVTTNFCRFPVLESLCQLESLKISYCGRVLDSGDLNLPSSLKKLTLSHFRLSWNHISTIGRLWNLEVLKLISGAFKGSGWDMTEGEFLQLKYLKLDTLNIRRWDASSDHLPQLQQLVLRNCKQLEEVPFDLVDIPTLEKIEVHQCGISAEESVRRIAEEEIEGLKILISNWHSDYESVS